jgi:uncharacterized membrane protein YebE (DUF533 family)
MTDMQPPRMRVAIADDEALGRERVRIFLEALARELRLDAGLKAQLEAKALAAG